MKKILLFGAGKSATHLIDYLDGLAAQYDWTLTIADANPQSLQARTGRSPHLKAIALDVAHEVERKILVREADMIISLLPPSLHVLIARDCLDSGKNLLTASYIDDATKKLESAIKKAGLFFLYEMGLDPGIDHMSAMELIHRLSAKNAKINSFRSHTGGLVAPESDDNPWHYKISWNPQNVVSAGSAGAVYKQAGEIRTIRYEDLFGNCGEVVIPGAGRFAFYPNRDSLRYIPLYGLEDASTFIRTTLRHPIFCRNWKYIVAAGLTDDKINIETAGLNINQWAEPLSPYLNEENRILFRYLGLFDEEPVPPSAKTSAAILRQLLETKLVMHPHDKDMVVMQHEIEFTSGGRRSKLSSSLVVKGDDSLHTAMAKTVGLPLGIAARLILQGKINLTGLHIPILPEIYKPVLEELAMHDIRFTEETK